MQRVAEISVLLALGLLGYVWIWKTVDRGPGYDDWLRNEIASIQPGDAHGAVNAYGYCAGELKPNQAIEPSLFLGSCAGPKLLYLMTTIEAGDPASIKEMLESVDRIHFDTSRHMPYLKSFARTAIQARCQKQQAPASCSNREIMNWFAN